MSYELAIVPCPAYTMEAAQSALEEALAAIDGLSWVRPGMRIAVKVNLVMAAKPEAAATTHPVLVAALCRMLKEKGAEVIVGDSPGGPFNQAYLSMVYAAAGMHLVEEYGAKLNRDFSQEKVQFPEGKAAREFFYSSWLKNADAIVDFCKLKTHGLTAMSCAVKNLFGVIPGTKKPEMHFQFPNHGDFSDMLLDLNEYVKPRLTLVDAVMTMEGNGPTQGNPRFMGALIAGTDNYAIDLFCSGLIGLQPKDVTTVAAAIRRGLCAESAEKLSVYGDPAPFFLPDFDTIPGGGHGGMSRQPKFIQHIMRGVFGSRPEVQEADCVGCGKCEGICPAKAIRVKNGKAIITRKNCIRCFCCQEFCPKGAIKVCRTPIAKLLTK